MAEVIPNFYFMSAQQYAKATKLGYQTTLRMCETGRLDAYQTDGGQWRVKIHKHEALSKDEFESLQEENKELKTKLEMVKKVLA